MFGEIAGLYDRMRPAYRSEVADQTLAHVRPETAAEVGAGTGKGTALFAGRGFPITAIEPDQRMSDRLTTRFPEVTVVTSTFEAWTPPPGGVDLLFAATAWHWVEPARRAALAAAALSPGGTLALIDRHTRITDPVLDGRIEEAFRLFPPATGHRAPLAEWAVPELTAFTDVTTWEAADERTVPVGVYLDQLRTLSPFRRRSADNQRGLLAELRARIDARGGAVPTRTVTALVLGRRSRA